MTTPEINRIVIDKRAEQRARAEQIAYELAGDRATPGIVRAMLALVEADERTDLA